MIRDTAYVALRLLAPAIEVALVIVPREARVAWHLVDAFRVRVRIEARRTWSSRHFVRRMVERRMRGEAS